MYSIDDLPEINTFLNIFRIATFYFRPLDRQVMQDIEWEHHCVLSSMFLTLFGVCALCVVLVAILFTLDEVDMERAVIALVQFMKKF